MRAYYDYPWKTVLHYVGGPLPATDGGTDPEEEPEMMHPVFVRLDGDPTEFLFNPWAGTLRGIANEDEKKAVMDLYDLAGVAIYPKAQDFGSQDAPWGARANDALSRGATFKGFERFEKHPSLRQTVASVIEKALRETPIAKLVRGDDGDISQ